MFEKLRHAFREAVDNFKEEMGRDEVPEVVDKLLVGMRDEVADAKVRIRDLEDQIERARGEAAREKKDARTATRRGEMAAGIGDTETAELATSYAEKHLERHRLLTEKAAALQKELAFRRGEVEEMLAKMKEAQAKRDTLAATVGRGDARESLRAAEDLFGELDRMAEKIGDEDARAKAAESFSEFDLHVDPDEPVRREEVDFDARLAELKRRMGEQ